MLKAVPQLLRRDSTFSPYGAPGAGAIIDATKFCIAADLPAKSMSKKTTIAKMRPDRAVVEVLSDASERPFPQRPMRPMTSAKIEAAAGADLDARPMTVEELRKARRVPRVKTLRRALALTQEEFARHYRIPLGTLRDWEQGRSEPDQPARAYLTVIARDPHAVRRALEGAPR